MSLWTIFIVAISLSMDAFSLSLIYGTLNISKRMIILTSITVGIFHFFMPLIGFLCGDILTLFFKFNPDILVGIIFSVLALEMFISVFKNEQVDLLTSLWAYLLFGFTVSVDSFSVGIGLGSLKASILLPCALFSIISFLFTYVGLKLGKTLALKFGTISTVIGSIILLILGLSYIF